MPLDVRPLVNPATTALLANEMQSSLIGGSQGVGGAGARVLPNIVRLADAGRSAGVQVMHCVKIVRRDALARNPNVVLYRRSGPPAWYCCRRCSLDAVKAARLEADRTPTRWPTTFP